MPRNAARAPIAHAAWIDHAASSLSGAGYHRGGAREAVIDLLARQRCALSAFEIEESLRGRKRKVSRASVYRILDELESLRLVSRVDLGQGIVRYEALHPGGDNHHHHLLCDECGAVFPFEDPELERTIERVADRITFDVAEHEIVLHGFCGDCGGRRSAGSGSESASS